MCAAANYWKERGIPQEPQAAPACKRAEGWESQNGQSKEKEENDEHLNH